MGNEECKGTVTHSLSQVSHGTKMIQHFWPVQNTERKKKKGKKGKKPANPNPFSVTQLKIMRFKACISSGNHDGNLRHDMEV